MKRTNGSQPLPSLLLTPARRLAVAAMLALVGLLTAVQGRAATLSWSGSASSDSFWSDSANWGFAGTPASGDTLIFSAGQPRPTNTNDIPGLTLNQIRFVGNGGGYNIWGNTFTLTNYFQATNSIGTNAIWNNVILTGVDQIINVTAGLEFDGNLSGDAGVIKNGPGVLSYFGAANPYSGTTTVNGGTMILNIGGIDQAFGGPLVVNAATVIAVFFEELPANQPITINNGGILNLSNAKQTIGPSLTLSGNGSVINGNPLLLSPNANVIANPGVLQNCVISGVMNVNSNTCTFNVGTGVNAGSLLVSAGVVGASTISKIGAGFMVLSASNSFSGPLNIAAGTLVTTSPWALGSTSGGTTVSNTATLQIDNSITNEPLTIASSGKGLVNAVGANTWVGNIVLAAQTTMEIDGTSLNLQGTISGAGGFNKTGLGSLRLTSAGNSYAGDTTVTSGVLELNGPNVIRFGTLTIGDGLGGANADVVRYVASDGIFGGPGGATIMITGSGLLDLNGFSDYAGPITMDGGTINTGTGLLRLASPLINVLGNATNGDSSVNGNLDLSVEANQLLIVSNTLRINAAISGPVGSTLTRTGPGVLVLNGANSYAGLTVLQQGITWAQTPTALGTNTSGTVVSNGTTLVLSGNLTITNESLTLNGLGFPGWMTLDCEGPQTNLWTGPIVLNATSSFGNFSPSGLMRLSGAISGAGGLVEGYSSGTLSLEGSVDNTYGGLTTVGAGTTLVLNKAGGAEAIPENLVINGTVRLLADQQITDSADVLVNGAALFDFTTHAEYINTLHGSGTVTFGSGGWIDVGNAGGSSTFDGSFTGVGYAPGWTVGKDGAGTFIMNGNNTFSAGNITVNEGTLLANGSQPQAAVISYLGSTFGGSGTVGTIYEDGILSPGNSPGILTSSNIAFTAAGIFTVELTGPNPGVGGYDQLNVHGTNALANAKLNLIPAFTTPVAVGQTFTILNNDASEAITGTFNGLPQGSGINVSNYGFTISYVGGTGNDIVLTLTNIPGTSAGYSVTLGNGSGSIDPNECNYLSLAISNKTGTAMTGVSATLQSLTPNVTVTQPFSPYADAPGNGRSTNSTLFQISTTTNFVCGTNINLQLAVTTASHGSFIVPFVLSSGSPSLVPLRYDQSTATNIPDIGTIESTNVVAGFVGPIGKVAVSLWLTHPVDSDLTLSLVSPDNTVITLVSATGSGANFGNACSPDSSRTTFDDSAATSITAGASPFAGTFRPQSALAGLFSAPPNGNWRLRITDSFGGSVGALRCWSLFLYPVSCSSGGGLCELCPNVTITAALGSNSIPQTGFLNTLGIPSSCASLATCPGSGAGGPFPSDNYIFRNGPSNACVTVTVVQANGLSDQMLSAVYTLGYDPSNPNKCINYLADCGNVISSINPTQSYSFMAASNGVYVVNVISSSPATLTPYTLTVSGGDCRPVLNINPAGPGKVQFDWTTAAANYRLESTNTLVVGATNWFGLTNVPIVVNSHYQVTNNAPPGSQFYRLHKP